MFDKGAMGCNGGAVLFDKGAMGCNGGAVWCNDLASVLLHFTAPHCSQLHPHCTRMQPHCTFLHPHCTLLHLNFTKLPPYWTKLHPHCTFIAPSSQSHRHCTAIAKTGTGCFEIVCVLCRPFLTSKMLTNMVRKSKVYEEGCDNFLSHSKFESPASVKS